MVAYCLFFSIQIPNTYTTVLPAEIAEGGKRKKVIQYVFQQQCFWRVGKYW
jgi:hypothetical protein